MTHISLMTSLVIISYVFKLSSSLPFLECFNTSLGIKAADKLFSVMSQVLNSLMILILCAPSSDNNVKHFCVRI